MAHEITVVYCNNECTLTHWSSTVDSDNSSGSEGDQPIPTKKAKYEGKLQMMFREKTFEVFNGLSNMLVSGNCTRGTVSSNSPFFIARGMEIFVMCPTR